MKVSLVIAWYDLWIGAYWDRKMKALYILPIPCIGIKIWFRDAYNREVKSFEKEWVKRFGDST